jgi:hypothetical protein
MLGDVRKPHRAWIFNQETEHAASGWEVTDGGACLGIDAVRDEVDQLSVVPDHPEAP